MKGFKTAIQALAGFFLSAAAAAAASTWFYPDGNDTLWKAGIFRLNVTGVGTGFSLLALLAFANVWIAHATKMDRKKTYAGTILNGFGFGFFPAAAIFKIFEQVTVPGRGIAVPEKIPELHWLTHNGYYMPSRIEFLLAVLSFIAVILWLSVRREPLPENGDLLGVCLSIWGGIRLMTEPFRESQLPAFGEIRFSGIAAGCTMLICLAFWVARAVNEKKNAGYAFACIPVFIAGCAVVLLQARQIISTGNPAAEMAVSSACALLAIKACLCMGRVSR